MCRFFITLWTAAYNLTDEARRWFVRKVSVLAALAVGVLLLGAVLTAGQVVPAEHPFWEGILQARLVLVRLVLAVLVLVIGVAAGVAIYQVLENTDLGKRLLIWAESDDALVEAQKTRNGGFLLASLLLACIVGLLLGVLR